ncbi:hypothetical protein RV15_GL001771 [Enterococcus silesiacus]|nr:hypothetical protein RV15_GL001771 [Enterococcus silesiacus]
MQLSVEAELPENQITKDAGYYDLKVTPGQIQELVLKVYNAGDKETTAKIEINPAYTGDGGTFVYSIDASKKDDSLKLPLSDIASTDENISIPAKSAADVIVKLAIPDEPFEGIIFGGIRVTDTQKEKEGTKESEEKDSSGFSISNKYAYTVAMRLRENNQIPDSNLQLKTISASQVVGRNAVKVLLQNPTPTIIDKVSYEAKIMKKGQSQVLFERKANDYRIAPNTNFNFPISWENKPFEAGTYDLMMTAKSEESGQKWDFKQEFTISAKEAKELNDKAIDLEQDYLKYIIYGAIAAAFLLVLIITLLVIYSKKKKKKRKKKRKAESQSKNKRRKGTNNGASKPKRKTNSGKRRPNGN